MKRSVDNNIMGWWFFKKETSETPFGMTMPGRSYNAHTLRHGFTGHEKESDLAEGIYTTEYRLYDTRVGRWLSVDPLFEKYVSMSPYNYCMLNPVMLVDPDGRKLIIVDGNRKIEYIPYKTTIEEAVTEFAKKAIVSLNYLYKNAPNTTQPVIDKVSKFEGKNGEKDIHIVETFGSNAFNVDSEIEWNSSAVDQCDNYYNYSPAENLFHELVHSYFQVLSQEDLDKMIMEDPSDPMYGTREDEIIIKEYETPLAVELGKFNPSDEHQYVRDSHKGCETIRHVNNPTSDEN